MFENKLCCKAFGPIQKSVAICFPSIQYVFSCLLGKSSQPINLTFRRRRRPPSAVSPPSLSSKTAFRSASFHLGMISTVEYIFFLCLCPWRANRGKRLCADLGLWHLRLSGGEGVEGPSCSVVTRSYTYRFLLPPWLKPCI